MNEGRGVDKMDWQRLWSSWPMQHAPAGDDGRIEVAGAMAMDGFWAKWRQRRRLARQLAELRGMSAYQLGDLGIASADIEAIAAGTFETPVSRSKKTPADVAGAESA
ncbi:DUF1127 domain-containing protein [Jeongeupia wiesaeckerbachi]|uniref:DUF1127 domain-containing protein n=1 Tax=Jeongeupia wiesaeckerbachi TaxID=3051218 RepID=UPI003D806D1F